MIKVKVVCPDKHTRTWLSQPPIKNKAACNVVLSASKVKTSNSMVLYGCVKGIDFLKGEGITIEDLVTDRHVTINGRMKTKEPEIHHYSDHWHVAKGAQL
ncbi:hypothetical protein IscW_ISCW007340 [Ixodes scapularis]|uniref:Uncharacterized protein n=1 Tax=Ixodes scapularis TaxID=6945 RepID=B7PSZ2_IXOSC|nr:hypothetical protein IscW_ISCW007340 [Ixodes scapularis]|eukprot:XP_002403398.1 hypothetical protein IscW_ISCW007340 [Ixodes scapularis]